jgi:hypothetical protein
MSEYKTFSSNEYPKVGEVCMVLRTKILDESTGKVGPTESFFGKFSIEDGIPYWGAGHRCKPIDQWKLVEFEASPKTQAEPPADCAQQTMVYIAGTPIRAHFDPKLTEVHKGLRQLWERSAPPADQTVSNQSDWKSWSQEIEECEKRIKYLEDMSKAQVERIEQLEDMIKKQENAHRALLEVFAMKDAKITKLQLELQGLNARLNSKGLTPA